MGVVIEIFLKCPGGPTRKTGTDIITDRGRGIGIGEVIGRVPLCCIPGGK